MTATQQQVQAGGQAAMWLPMVTLWRREVLAFFRERHRVASALLTPAVLWLLIGSGFDRQFSPVGAGGASDQVSYLAYFFPGTVSMILLFTAIFSTITVIEDRRAGFLQGVLVSPAPRLAIALGKITGGATIALVHAAVFVLLWPVVGGMELSMSGLAMLAASLVWMGVMAVGLTALGLCIAWPMQSTAGFHAIMMLFLMPMWFLSGAMFPVSGAATWLKPVMWANPLTYGQAVLTHLMTGGELSTGAPGPAWLWAVIGTSLVTGGVLLATKLVGARRKDGQA